MLKRREGTANNTLTYRCDDYDCDDYYDFDDDNDDNAERVNYGILDRIVIVLTIISRYHTMTEMVVVKMMTLTNQTEATMTVAEKRERCGS